MYGVATFTVGESSSRHQDPLLTATLAVVTAVVNMRFTNVAAVGPYTFIGTGPNRTAAQDDAARNVLYAIGFDFRYVL